MNSMKLLQHMREKMILEAGTERGLVVEVGSGAEPCPEADVLVDLHDDPIERAGSLLQDRPFVYADAQALPFADMTFGFSIARHVLEHVEYPALMLSELQRVSPGGYIETPNALEELIRGWPFHRWIVSVRNDELEIRPNNVPRGIRKLVDYLAVSACPEFLHFLHVHRHRMLTSFAWEGPIRFRILPAFDCDSDDPSVLCDKPSAPNPHTSTYSRLRLLLPARVLRPYRILRGKMHDCFARWNRKHINLHDYLRCPICLGTLTYEDRFAICRECKHPWPKRNGFFDFVIGSDELQLPRYTITTTGFSHKF